MARSATESPAANFPVRALICGYEKSGTTLLNEILRRHPRLDSGFEGGMLLGDSPRDFPGIQPYFAYFRQKWRLSREDMEQICDTDDWATCYRRIRDLSPVIADKNCELFDKTPIYMKQLSEVLARVPGVPCVVNVRDPRALMLSWARWSGHSEDPELYIRQNLANYCQRYLDYARGYHAALPRYGDRIYLNRFESLCLEPQPQLEKIFDFLGLCFEPDFLHFSSEYFVYGNTVSTDYLFPYQGVLSEEVCQAILAGTAECAEWHFGEST